MRPQIMDVFLIPIARDRYEPYFEPEDDAVPVVEAGQGWFARLRRRFAEMLREAEAERHRRHAGTSPPPAGLGARFRRTVMRWIVERAAEQRLLWHLRTATAARLHAPDDLADADALRVLHSGMRRDMERHRRWFAVHLVGLLGSLALVLIPGPNLVGYLLTFTTVGHLLAWRGASQGLARVAWTVVPNATLRELREVEASPSPERESRVREVADRLGLRHLSAFVARLAVPPA
ncbi:MAG: hypothetical protein R2745_18080 [Vicinamibacterales bacterium]